MAAQHSQYQLNIWPAGDSRRRGGSKYNEPSHVSKFSRLSFFYKLELGPIQGDLLVRLHSNVAQVWEQKEGNQKNTILPGRERFICER